MQAELTFGFLGSSSLPLTLIFVLGNRLHNTQEKLRAYLFIRDTAQTPTAPKLYR